VKDTCGPTAEIVWARNKGLQGGATRCPISINPGYVITQPPQRRRFLSAHQKNKEAGKFLNLPILDHLIFAE
jgi:hypothetical protein